jgi:hypothetical protein
MYPFVTRLVGVKHVLEQAKNLQKERGIRGGSIMDTEGAVSPLESPAPARVLGEEVNTLKIGTGDRFTT